MKNYTVTLLALAFLMSTGIYDYTVPKIDGGMISINDLRDKKILFVNIATGSDRVTQLGQLQQLQEQYADSLVIIGFPSNSFGNESRNNAAKPPRTRSAMWTSDNDLGFDRQTGARSRRLH